MGRPPVAIPLDGTARLHPGGGRSIRASARACSYAASTRKRVPELRATGATTCARGPPAGNQPRGWSVRSFPNPGVARRAHSIQERGGRMQIRLIAAALALAVIAIALASWPRQKAGQSPEGSPPAAGSADQASPEPVSDAAPADPGIEWTPPSRWTAQSERPMRLATYLVPAAPGDREGAEGAVFYFGPN